MSDSTDVLYCIARQIRTHSERIAEKKRWFGLSLDGFCAHGAVLLYQALSGLGLRPQLAVSEDDDSCGHCFVLCEGHIVDVTATQFGKSEVEILAYSQDPQDELFPWFWRARQLFDSPQELAAFLEDEGWPAEQIPCVAQPAQQALVA